MSTRPQFLNLGRRGLQAFDAHVAQEATCTRGSVWITLDGDERDIVLDAGESFVVPANRRAVVYAFEVSQVTLRPAEPAATYLPGRPARTTAQVAV